MPNSIEIRAILRLKRSNALPELFRKGVAALACVNVLLAGKICHNTAVFGPASLVLVAGDRLGFAVAFGGYAPGINMKSFTDVFLDVFRTTLRQILVMCVAGGAVGMT